MGDDTGYPSSAYPGGSEDDFNRLREELAVALKALEDLYRVSNAYLAEWTAAMEEARKILAAQDRL